MHRSESQWKHHVTHEITMNLVGIPDVPQGSLFDILAQECLPHRCFGESDARPLFWGCLCGGFLSHDTPSHPVMNDHALVLERDGDDWGSDILKNLRMLCI